MDDWDDWDLQAVVRGCGGLTPATRDPFSSLRPPLKDCGLALEDVGGSYRDLLAGFADSSGTAPSRETGFEELEQLCRPFFHSTSPAPQQKQQHHLASTLSVPLAPRLYPDGGCITRGRPLLQPAVIQPPSRSGVAVTSRSKRRKNQQKKVVCQVPADALSSDVWAWRKYGQKPIKGSPYPRGYYRCSSSKGCLARKQVERSRSDPGIYIITYTAEHNHPVPTHRNSLAGSTRHKFPPATPQPPSSCQSTDVSPGNKNNPAPSKQGAHSTSPLSPGSPLRLPADDGDPLFGFLSRTEKEGNEVDEEEEEEDDDEGMLLLGDMDVMGEDDVFFLGLDELSQPFPSAIGSLAKECSAPAESSSAPMR